MIKNAREYQITKAQAARFERALVSDVDPKADPAFARLEHDALRGQLADLRAELEDYDAVPCECGSKQARWHGDTLRVYACDKCWKKMMPKTSRDPSANIVFYRMSSEPHLRKVESFPSAAAAKRWVAMMKAANNRHPDEAQFSLETARVKTIHPTALHLHALAVASNEPQFSHPNAMPFLKDLEEAGYIKNDRKGETGFRLPWWILTKTGKTLRNSILDMTRDERAVYDEKTWGAFR